MDDSDFCSGTPGWGDERPAAVHRPAACVSCASAVSARTPEVWTLPTRRLFTPSFGAFESGFPEEILEVLDHRASAVPPTIPCREAAPRSKIFTSIRSFPIEDPLGIRFSAFVVGGCIVVRTAETDVKICSTTIAYIAKSDRFPGRKRDFGLTGWALHRASLRQVAAIRQL